MNLLNDAQKAAVKQAVVLAESRTSGEIRVYIALQCKGEILDAAAATFAKLEMHKTQERNGVLIFIAIENKQFAIIGDAGINAKVPLNFWEDIKNHMRSNFANGAFVEGLTEAITMAGEALEEYFPYKNGDVNELNDDIVFGDE